MRRLLELPLQFDVCLLLSTESEITAWRGQGLPADTLSCQNAVAILHVVQPPLIIDPSSQVSALSVHVLSIPRPLWLQCCA